MEICIHRGSRQIGGSCVELKSGGKRLLLDLGLPLDAEGNGEKYLPDVKGLDGSDPSLLGILISHPHLDHHGLLCHVSRDIPVGIGSGARKILEAAAPFMPFDCPPPAPGWDYKSEKSFDIGPFTITPFLVDHSAFDAYALLIDDRDKRVFYSGDLRGHGRKASLFKSMTNKPPDNVDILLLEGASLGRLDEDQEFPTEPDIENQMVDLFTETTGMALVQASGQNIDRIVSIFRASKRTGRKLIVDLYTAAVLEATGKKSIPQSYWDEVSLFVPWTQRVQIKEYEWFGLLRKHSKNRLFQKHLKGIASSSTFLFRPLHMKDLVKGDCLADAVYVYSLWEGYWDEGNYDRVKKWLKKHNIPKYSIHTSGHAAPKELKKLAEAMNPEKVVPIHSFHPEHYSELFSNVETHPDGEWWEV